jgi:hypothetical protein
MTIDPRAVHWDASDDMGGGRSAWPHIENPYLDEDSKGIDETSRAARRRINALRIRRECLERALREAVDAAAAPFLAELEEVERLSDQVYAEEFSRLSKR